MFKKKVDLILVAIFCSCYSFSNCYAADVDQYQSAKRQEIEQKRQIEAPVAKLEQKVMKKDTEKLPIELYRFPIKKIKFITDGKTEFLWVQRKAAPYCGRLIGAQGVNHIVKILNNALMEKGYITSTVLVPEQNMKSGVLNLSIVPGYIEDIRFSDPKLSGTWRNAFPCHIGDVLNIHDLEQGLEQMRRVPGQEVTLDIKAGSKEGYSIVVLDVKRGKSWSMGLSLDDSGMEDTGRLQSTGSFSLNNPTGLNDVFSFSYTKDIEREDALHGTKNTSFYYALPIGNYTFTADRTYNEYHQIVPAVIPFSSRGKTTNWNFGLQKVFYRDKLRKSQLAFKVLRRTKKSYVDGEEMKVQGLQTTAYQIGLMHRQFVGQGVADVYLYYQKGMPWFNAEPGWGDFNPEYMTTRYGLWGINLYYGTPLKLGNIKARYSCTMRGQYTNNMLYGADQFSIGSRYTVRGFSGENTLSGENGFFIRNDLGFPLKKVTLEPYIGLDYGCVWGQGSENSIGHTLAGGVIGIRGQAGPTVTYEAFMGTPLYKPTGFLAGKTSAGFNLTWNW